MSGESVKPNITRHVFFLLAVLAVAALMYGPLTDLFRSPLRRDYHTLIPAIPCIAAYLFYLIRKDIFRWAGYGFSVGLPVVAAGVAVYAAGRYFIIDLNPNDFASVTAFSAWVVLLGGFISAYGLRAFRIALFPLLFLVLMVPLPAFVMEKIITFLQVGSTEFTNVLLLASGAPFLREGFVFHLPVQSVEVAPQCSGIRSGLALIITALLAGHLFLRTGWKKLLLVLLAIPVTMFKNGIRITTLTLLGTYVDPRILQSSLHREGGIPFFVLALLLMAPILYFLRKSERKGEKQFLPEINIERRKGV
ncbi:MAG: Transmembrane exosortase (Exosortase_EpsH) [Syntrophus sp. PtaB.Bin138]|nr:MAG: Transmembrane exosortase (Exosortase_EpsH) [Syntrophus sp. PtaB.Bin138]